MTQFYVYEHWRPDKDVCFYVGKGQRDRAYDLFGRNPHHKRVVAKLKNIGLQPEIRIIADGLPEDDAFRLEKEIIAKRRIAGLKLTNLTDGGEGASGLRHSQESRAERSEQMRGNKRAVGFICPPERRAKISAAQKGKPRQANLTEDGRRRKLEALHRRKGMKMPPRTPEARARQSAAQRGKNFNPRSLVRRLTNEVRESIISDYAGGLGLIPLAEKYAACHKTLKKILVAADVQIKRRGSQPKTS